MVICCFVESCVCPFVSEAEKIAGRDKCVALTDLTLLLLRTSSLQSSHGFCFHNEKEPLFFHFPCNLISFVNTFLFFLWVKNLDF